MKRQQTKKDGPKHNFQSRQCATSVYQAAYDFSPNKDMAETKLEKKPPVPKINMASVQRLMVNQFKSKTTRPAADETVESEQHQKDLHCKINSKIDNLLSPTRNGKAIDKSEEISYITQSDADQR